MLYSDPLDMDYVLCFYSWNIITATLTCYDGRVSG